MRRKRAAGPLAALLAALLATSGCGSGEDDSRGGKTRASESPAVARRDAAPTGVAEGEFVVSVVGGLVRLASREAPRRAILERLANLEGFELDARELPARRITLQLDEVTLAGALALLIDDASYESAFEFDAGLGRSRLVALRVGRGAAGEGSGRVAREVGERRLPRFPSRLPVPGEEVAADLDEEERHWVEALDSANDRERREAVEQVDIEGPVLGRVIELASADPDPLVRMGAIERLEESETFAATGALIEVLEDRDPEVVLRAIEALEYAGDETVVPYLEPLRRHPDPKVRQAVDDAIPFLGW